MTIFANKVAARKNRLSLEKSAEMRWQIIMTISEY
jgi:hypothetical protein